MITDALRYPRTSDDWVKTVLIGGLLALLGVLVVPTILVAGYVVRVLRDTMHGDETPPRFDEWGLLARDGLPAAVIALVYGIVPGITVAATAALAALIAGPGPRSGLLVGGVTFVGGLVALAATLLAAYVVPAALANYAERGSLRHGFAVDDLRPVLTSGTYATAWLAGVAVVVVGGIVGGLLNVVPVLGTIVGAVVSFYALTAAYYIVGNAWGDVRGLDRNGDGGETDAGSERVPPTSRAE